MVVVVLVALVVLLVLLVVLVLVLVVLLVLVVVVVVVVMVAVGVDLFILSREIAGARCLRASYARHTRETIHKEAWYTFYIRTIRQL